jgi:hypothetical protein
MNASIDVLSLAPVAPTTADDDYDQAERQVDTNDLPDAVELAVDSSSNSKRGNWDRALHANGRPLAVLDYAKCGQRQDADPAILRSASDPCERGIDPEAPGLSPFLFAPFFLGSRVTAGPLCFRLR